MFNACELSILGLRFPDTLSILRVVFVTLHRVRTEQSADATTIHETQISLKTGSSD